MPAYLTSKSSKSLEFSNSGGFDTFEFHTFYNEAIRFQLVFTGFTIVL